MTAAREVSLSNRLAGKVAIVTGGSSGIGLATWREFVRLGARVIITDSRELPGPVELPSECRFIRHDVRDRQGWSEVVALAQASFGGLQVLVNAAGILREGSIESTDMSTWADVMAVNVEGAFWGCQAALPAMLESANGSIVNVSSVSGLRGDAQLAAYSASKGALLSLTKDIAAHCTSRKMPVRCNSVHPGVVDTPMIDVFFEQAVASTRADWMAAQPIGRTIRPNEVASLIAWLASDAARYVTSSEYVVDGGLTA